MRKRLAAEVQGESMKERPQTHAALVYCTRLPSGREGTIGPGQRCKQRRFWQQPSRTLTGAAPGSANAFIGLPIGHYSKYQEPGRGHSVAWACVAEGGTCCMWWRHAWPARAVRCGGLQNDLFYNLFGESGGWLFFEGSLLAWNSTLSSTG